MSLTYFIKHKKYLDQIKEDISDVENVISKSGKINLKSFDLHDELNKTFWDKKDKLRKDIREQLLQIAHDFYKTLDIAEITEVGDSTNDETFDEYVKDVLFVGSLASFNYSSYADVDLHLLMDEKKLSDGNELALNILKKYFNECKNDWNLHHSDLKVEGYDCELYVQDVEEENASNGCYSLMQDKWIIYPKELDTSNFDKDWVSKKALSYIEQIDELEETINSKSDMELIEKAKDELKKIKDKIVQGRRDSLAAGQGEMNKYNILFKILRRSGHIEKINDLTNSAYDMLNSIDKNTDKFEEDKMRFTDKRVLKEDENADAFIEFKSMYGPRAAKALEKYLAKRVNKSAAGVLESDEEFEKFGNWAWKHLGIDVYERFSGEDIGDFLKRTSKYAGPSAFHDARNDPADSWAIPSEWGLRESREVKTYEIIEEDDNNQQGNNQQGNNNQQGGNQQGNNKDDGKLKLIIGSEDENNSIIISAEDPASNNVMNIVASKFGAKEWNKDEKFNPPYWYISVPKNTKDAQAQLNGLQNVDAQISTAESNDSLSKKITAKSWDELVKAITTKTHYKVDSAFQSKPEAHIKLIDKNNGKTKEVEVTSYPDGGFELILSDESTTDESKVLPLNEGDN